MEAVDSSQKPGDGKKVTEEVGMTLEDSIHSPTDQEDKYHTTNAEKGLKTENDQSNNPTVHAGPSCAAIMCELSDCDHDLENDKASKDEEDKPSVNVDADDDGRDSATVGKVPKRKAYSYKDIDKLNEEIGEIYAYYEMRYFPEYKDAFRRYLNQKNVESWKSLEKEQRRDFLMTILNDCDLVNEKKRYNAIFALNYLAQGCWGEFESLEEQLESIVENVELMLECNTFWTVWMNAKLMNSAFIDLWNIGEKELALEGCYDVLCTIMNVALIKTESSVVAELVMDLKATGLEAIFSDLVSSLIAITEFNQSCFFLKKILILIRLFLLLVLGGTDKLRESKEMQRKLAGLKPSKDDTLLVCETIGILQDSHWWKDGTQRRWMTLSELEDVALSDSESENSAETVPNGAGKKKSFPWSPKSSLESFLDTRNLIGEHTQRTHKYQRCLTLPSTLKERTKLLVQHLHVPLGEFQKEQEKLISKYPALFGRQEKIVSPETDSLFVSLLPRMDDFLDALRLILVEAVPRITLRAQTEFFVPMDADPVFYDEDRFRQSEIVVKAISSILILLLKHFKLNHVYQFECLATKMVTISYIPTILRFFNRDTTPYAYQRCRESVSPFKIMQLQYTPYHVVENESARRVKPVRNFSKLLYRNVFAYTNLLRVLNKLVKGNQCRIRALNMLSPIECFRRVLSVRDPFLQQYSLKLMKMLCKFVSQDWKRSNPEIVTGIYYKVRHRISDGWIGEISFSNRAKKSKFDKSSMVWPWDFSADELRLIHAVNAYINRRFGTPNVLSDSCSYFRERAVQNQNRETLQRSKSDPYVEPSHEEYENWVNSEESFGSIDWNKLTSDQFVI